LLLTHINDDACLAKLFAIPPSHIFTINLIIKVEPCMHKINIYTGSMLHIIRISQNRPQTLPTKIVSCLCILCFLWNIFIEFLLKLYLLNHPFLFVHLTFTTMHQPVKFSQITSCHLTHKLRPHFSYISSLLLYSMSGIYAFPDHYILL
jgi:hypothetical protein